MTLLLLIIYITFISLGLPDSMLGSSFPAIASNLDLPSNMSGYVGMVVSACTIISSLFSSFLVKKLSTKLVVSISVLLTAIALICFSFVGKNYGFLFYVIAIPLGLGAGAIDSALNNYVALHYKAIHMNWLHCSWGIGASIGPLIIGSFIDSNNNSSGWNYGVFTIGIIQIIISILLFSTLSLWNKVSIKKEIKMNKKEGEYFTQDNSKKYDFKMIFSKPIVYLALFGFFCYCALESTTGLWIGNFFHKGLEFSTEQAAMFTSTFYIGITVGRFICGPLSLFWREKAMMRLGELIILTGILLTFLTFNRYVPIVGFVVVGLGCAPIYPAIIRSTPYRFSKQWSYRIMGFEMAAAYSGNLLMPPLFGTIAELVGGEYKILPIFMISFALGMIVCHESINISLDKRDKILTEEEKEQFYSY